MIAFRRCSPWWGTVRRMGSVPPRDNSDGNQFGRVAEGSNLALQASVARGVDRFSDHDPLEAAEAKIADIYRPHPSDYLKQIHRLLEDNDLRSALNVLEVDMRRERVRPNGKHFRILIHACGRVGHVRKAYELFQEYQSRALDWNQGILADVLNACANAREKTYALDKARQIKGNLDARNVQCSRVVYNNLIKAYGRCGHLELAMATLDEMKTKGLALEAETFNHVLHGCISDKNAGFRHAILAWRLALRHRVALESHSYNLLLRVAIECGVGDQKFAHDVLLACMSVQEAREHGDRLLAAISPLGLSAGSPGLEVPSSEPRGGVTLVEASELIPQSSQLSSLPNILHQQPDFSAVVGLDSMANSQDRFLMLGGMEGFFEHLRHQKVKPDVKTFSMALKLIESSEAAELRLLELMDEAQVHPDTDFFNQMIKRRAYRMEHASGHKVLELINRYALPVDLMTYGNVALCCRTRAESLALLDDLKSQQYRPNIEIMAALVRFAIVRLNPKDVLIFLQIMERESIQPSRKLLKQLEKFNRTFKDFVYKAERSQMRKQDLPKVIFYEFERDFAHWKEYWAFYQSWLRRTELEPFEHPHKQYLTEKDYRKAEEGVPYLKKIIANDLGEEA